jgi:hypothetical protein
MARDPVLALARSALGFKRLRPGQREAVKALVEFVSRWMEGPAADLNERDYYRPDSALEVLLRDRDQRARRLALRMDAQLRDGNH